MKKYPMMKKAMNIKKNKIWFIIRMHRQLLNTNSKTWWPDEGNNEKTKHIRSIKRERKTYRLMIEII